MPHWVTVLGAILVVAAAIFGRNPHPHVMWESIPAYGAVFGYAGARALVYLAKTVLAPRLRGPASEKEA